MTRSLESARSAHRQTLQFRPAATRGVVDTFFTWRPSLPPWLLGGYCALVVCVVLFVVQVPYTDKVRAEGLTEPLLQAALLTAAGRGQVVSVEAGENQEVSADQVLVVIAIGARGPGGEHVDQHAVERLKLQRQSLRSEREHFAASFAAARDRLRAQRERLVQQEHHAVENLHILERRASLIEVEHARVDRLAAAGWISQQDVRRSELDRLAAEHAVVEGRRDLDQAGANLLQLDHRLANDAASTAQALARFDAQIADVRQELRLLKVQAQRAVVAPFDGRIADLQAFVGQQVKSGEHLMSVVPAATAAHRIVLWLPVTAGGRVHEGMAVRLRYAGYPVAEHGSGTGTIERISPLARTAAPGVLRYRALVAVTSLPRNADRVPAGMAVDADIVVARKPLWMWFLEPLREAMERL